MKHIVVTVFLALLAGSGPAQVQWNEFPLIPGRFDHALAYDEARGRTVVFGGYARALLSDTWEWDGTHWLRRFPANSPSAQARHGLAYDAVRSRVVLFGGSDGGTWEWDGNVWTQRFPVASPSSRSRYVMAWDSLRRRVLLFGGGGPGPSETWQWDGTNWLQLFPSLSPTGLGSMTYDATRDRMVAIGDTTADTWEWDGSTWTRRSPAQRPTSTGALAYDAARQRTVLYDGRTWEWDGNDWLERTTGGRPRTNWGHAATYDSARKRVVLFGGSSGPFWATADTWEWDGNAWLPRETRPFQRSEFALAYDASRDRVVLFGGLGQGGPFFFGDTWEWDGTRWEDRTPTTGPIYRYRHSLVYDSIRQRVMLFGGAEHTGEWTYYNDLWEWDGTRWLRRSVGPGPEERVNAQMAFDAKRDRIVLFGGGLQNYSCSAPNSSVTWEWDGARWLARNPLTRPPGCGGKFMVYDFARERTVMYDPYSGTWEWDGSDWARRPSTRSPPFPDSMAYDSARGRTVVVGGFPPEVWEWDGREWTQRTPTGSGPTNNLGAIAHDSRRGRIVYFDFFLSGWEYIPVNPATFAAFGGGCAGSAGTPSLLALGGSRPWTGERFSLELTNLPPGNSALVWLGLSRTAWGSLALPLPLAPVGMPGCELRVRPDFSFAVFNRSGSAVLGLDVPADGALVGAAFYNQALVADRAANAFGATVSNGGEGRVGSK